MSGGCDGEVERGGRGREGKGRREWGRESVLCVLYDLGSWFSGMGVGFWEVQTLVVAGFGGEWEGGCDAATLAVQMLLESKSSTFLEARAR
jgi:hypothetical protein